MMQREINAHAQVFIIEADIIQLASTEEGIRFAACKLTLRLLIMTVFRIRTTKVQIYTLCIYFAVANI